MYLHQIKNPNLPFPECNIVQHAVRLKAENAGSLTLNANYKLGPVIGSVCDSIYRMKEEWNFVVTPTLVNQMIRIWSRTFLEFSIPLEFKIFDILGKLVLTKSINSENLPEELDLGEYSSGPYFYSISNGNQILKTGKFVVF